MPSDERTRINKARVDNEAYRRIIERARDLIYKKGYVAGNDHSEALLKDQSLVAATVSLSYLIKYLLYRPIILFTRQNAFSKKLGEFGFNLFSMLVVDLMHEFELGVWKAVFIHLVRILYALGNGAISEFNRR